MHDDVNGPDRVMHSGLNSQRFIQVLPCEHHVPTKKRRESLSFLLVFRGDVRDLCLQGKSFFPKL